MADQPKQTETNAFTAQPQERLTHVPETGPEQPVTPEQRAAESGPVTERLITPEQDEGFLDEAIDALKQKLRSKKTKQVVMPQARDQVTMQIEKIMEEGLADAYSELTPIQQQEFKIEGEKAAWQIRQLLKQAHVRVKKIFEIIVAWLRMLPGVNRLFAEQEAKIKVDRILALKRSGLLQHSKKK